MIGWFTLLKLLPSTRTLRVWVGFSAAKVVSTMSTRSIELLITRKLFETSEKPFRKCPGP